MLAAGDDPLARVFELDSSRFTRGITIGIIGALIVHGAGATEAVRLANGIGVWARDTGATMHEYFTRLYEVEMVNAPPPPPPPPAEEPKPEPEAPKPAAAAPKAARDAPPPAPAQAGKILTQEPDPEAPVDLTGQGFVTGNADAYAGGVTANSGTSKTAVRDLNAVAGGVPGGTGTKVGAPVPSGPDLSRPAGVEGSTEWNAPFPPEADEAQIDYQRVQIVVTVRPDGTAQDVKVVNDPGNGFGREARKYALRKIYKPAFNREGHPVQASIPIWVTFTR